MEATMPANYETILTETRDRVGIIRLNRPQRMNALNDVLARELGTALHAFDDDPAIGCIVVWANPRTSLSMRSVSNRTVSAPCVRVPP